MKTELKLNKCVGITQDGELVMVNSLFVYSDGMHGATGASFVGITQAEIDERNDLENVIDNYGYLWSEAVSSGTTVESQEQYMQSIVDSYVTGGDGYYLGHDSSYIYDIPDTIKKMHYDGCETFECVGGGRIFPIREKMMIIFDEDLFMAIQMIEQEPYDLEIFQELVGGELRKVG